VTKDEMAEVLAAAATFDGRTLSPEIIDSWHGLMGHLDFRESMARVRRHYAFETRRLMPADLNPDVDSLEATGGMRWR